MLTSKTLQQILDVLKYSEYNHNSGRSITSSYQTAINRVAKEYDVTYQTIGDGCRRRLELRRIDEFRDLISKWLNGNEEPLVKVLKRKTPTRLHSKIDDFFKSKQITNEKEFEKRENKISLKINIGESENRYLKALSQIEGKEETDIISSIISDGIKDRFRKIAQELR